MPIDVPVGLRLWSGESSRQGGSSVTPSCPHPDELDADRILAGENCPLMIWQKATSYAEPERLKLEPATAHIITQLAELGPLILRSSLATRTRTALLGLITIPVENQAAHSVEEVAAGGDERDVLRKPFAQLRASGIKRLFELIANSLSIRNLHTRNRADSALLFEAAHATHGMSKLMNVRGQRIVDINTATLAGGEFGLWDQLHAPIRGIGLHLGADLDAAGFRYVACPEGVSATEYLEIEALLKTQAATTHDQTLFVPHAHAKLTLHKLSTLKIEPKQSKGFPKPYVIAIGTPAAFMPMGFLVHIARDSPQPRLIASPYDQTIVQTMRIAVPDYYHLSPDGQRILIDGAALGNTLPGQSTVTQNGTINALIPTLNYLEREFGFVLPLGRRIRHAKSLIRTALTHPPARENFLVADLLSKMLEPLIAMPSVLRNAELADKFRQPYANVREVNVRLARYLDLRDAQGTPLVLEGYAGDQAAFELPKLCFSKHRAAVIAVGTLATEQILLEVLTVDALAGRTEAVVALQQTFGRSGTRHYLQRAAKIEPTKLGGQYVQSAELLATVRAALGFTQTRAVIRKSQNDASSHVDLTMRAGIVKLQRCVAVLLAYQKACGSPETLRGVHYGLALLTQRG